jgi:hypothetical protein
MRRRISKPLDDGSVRAIKWLIVAGVIASVAHFADNAFEIGRYPEPGWITSGIVLFAWLPDAIVAAAALFRKNGDLVFVMLAAVFGLLLLTGLAHYSYGSPTSMAALSNFTIVFEAISGVTLLAVLCWSIGHRGKTSG